MPHFDPSILRPGDCLIYTGHDPFDLAIQFKTFSRACHIEVFIGNNSSLASRNGKGCSCYPLRTKGLYRIRRPTGMFDLSKGIKYWGDNLDGLPYGFMDLLNFIEPFGVIRSKGRICSQAAALFYAGCGYQFYADDYFPGDITPRDFLVTRAFMNIVF